MSYKASIELAAGVKPKNGGDFKLVNFADVYVDPDTSLDVVLADILSRLTKLEENVPGILDNFILDESLIA